MPNYEKNQMEEKMQQAMECLSPDETTKNRMYAELMRRAALQETTPKRPWYLRWQISAGACTAALACVVIAMTAIHARMPQGTGELSVLTPESVTTTVAEEAVPDQDTATQTTLGNGTEQRQTTETAAVAAQDVTSMSETVPVAAAPEETCPAEAGKSETDGQGLNEAAQTSLPAVTTEAKQTAAATAVVTQPPAKTTTAVPKTTAPSKESQVVTTVAQTEASTETKPVDIPIRQNIYLYYKLTWEGFHYDTQYEKVPSRMVGEYLGYSVTSGADVDDTYTVLIYAIEGIDSTQRLAVQYAGEDSYYVFTAR